MISAEKFVTLVTHGPSQVRKAEINLVPISDKR